MKFQNFAKKYMHQWAFTRWQKKQKNVIWVFCIWCRFNQTDAKFSANNVDFAITGAEFSIKDVEFSVNARKVCFSFADTEIDEMIQVGGILSFKSLSPFGGKFSANSIHVYYVCLWSFDASSRVFITKSFWY